MPKATNMPTTTNKIIGLLTALAPFKLESIELRPEAIYIIIKASEDLGNEVNDILGYYREAGLAIRVTWIADTEQV